MAEGAVLQAPVTVRYALGVGNGRHTSLNRAGDAGDANKSRAFVAHSSVSLPLPVGVQVGGAYYADRVTPRAGIDATERTVSAYIAAERETPEVVVEYARITHESKNGSFPTSTSESGYVLFAYRLPGALSAFKPYTRFDRTRVPVADSVFAPLGLDFSGRVVGIRYDVASAVALKLEYRSERVQGGPALSTIATQLSFTFPGTSTEPTVAVEHEERAAHSTQGRRQR
jgi:hypothetical protein